jgi:hypothetical protein
LRWQIADSYYMYRDKYGFKSRCHPRRRNCRRQGEGGILRQGQTYLKDVRIALPIQQAWRHVGH